MFCARFIILYTFIAIDITSFRIADGVAVNDDYHLYSGIDEVIELNEFNINSSIYESEKSWVVRYYVQDAHCVEFKSVWADVAKELYIVRDVSVAAFNCFHVNIPSICQKNHINKFPSIIYYKPNSTHASLGIEIEESQDDKILARAIINLMRKHRKVDTNTIHPWIKHTNLFRIHNATEENVQHELATNAIILYSICGFTGGCVLVCVIWYLFACIKRSLTGNLNVYTILH